MNTLLGCGIYSNHSLLMECSIDLHHRRPSAKIPKIEISLECSQNKKISGLEAQRRSRYDVHQDPFILFWVHRDATLHGRTEASKFFCPMKCKNNDECSSSMEQEKATLIPQSCSFFPRRHECERL